MERVGGIEGCLEGVMPGESNAWRERCQEGGMPGGREGK